MSHNSGRSRVVAASCLCYNEKEGYADNKICLLIERVSAFSDSLLFHLLI